MMRIASCRLMSTTRNQIIKQINATSNVPILFTCEHGGQVELPDTPIFVDKAAELRNTHWAYDPGALELLEEMCKETGATGIASLVTRLYCDTNRPVGSPTLARHECDEITIPVNANMTEKERIERIQRVWLPYHVTAARMANEVQAEMIISLHSFNPVYQGEVREHVEIGVLSSFNDELAFRVINAFQKDGFKKVLHNVPYSAKTGLSMFSPDQLAASGETPRSACLIEVRNDLLVKETFRRKLVRSLTTTLLEQLQLDVAITQ